MGVAWRLGVGVAWCGCDLETGVYGLETRCGCGDLWVWLRLGVGVAWGFGVGVA